MHHLQAIVHGRVQGVGFRGYVVQRADERGLAGLVRNLHDGSVEVRAEGTLDELEALLEDLRVGPTRARVEHVETCWSEGPALHRGFEVRG